MKLAAHAKINLNLRIVGRRPDGYHDLETLMVPLALHDVVEVDLDSEISVSSDAQWLPCGPDNLAHRAAAEFYKETGLGGGARIYLRKAIPAGAGLGGGSSDAAAVLRALDTLHQTHLATHTLENIAASIGSDAPWFIRSLPSVCRGRGEIIEPIPLTAHPHILLLKPPFEVSTPWAYRAWASAQNHSLPEIQELDWVRIFNHLETPVFQKYLLLPALKSWLRAQNGVLAAAMSGSGSTLFAILSQHADPHELATSARTTFGETLWICLSRILLNTAAAGYDTLRQQQSCLLETIAPLE